MMTAPASTATGTSAVSRPIAAVLAAFVGTRVVVAAGYLFAKIANDDPEPLTLDQGLLAWDGSWYEWIASLGFDGAPEGAIRFFPLYPLLGRWLGGSREDIALVVITNACALLAGGLLFHLARRELDDEAAHRAVWWMALFPAAFVLVFAYSEALFLALTLAAMLLIRQRRWALAAIAAVLASLTRPTGVLLGVFVLFELWADHRDSAEAALRYGLRQVAAKLAALLAPLAGLLVFLVWAQSSQGDWRAPLDAQREIRGSFHEPISRTAIAFWRGIGGDQSEMIHGFAAVGFGAALVLARRRLPISYLAYGAIGLVIGLSAETINSFERYGLGLVPVLLAIAAVPLGRRAHLAGIALSGSLLLVLTAFALDGTYVP